MPNRYKEQTVKATIKADQQEPDWTPMEALEWLKSMRRRVKFGANHYQSVIVTVRNLVQQRADRDTEIDKLKAEVARLQALKTPVPYDVGGSGTWGENT